MYTLKPPPPPPIHTHVSSTDTQASADWCGMWLVARFRRQMAKAPLLVSLAHTEGDPAEPALLLLAVQALQAHPL